MFGLFGIANAAPIITFEASGQLFSTNPVFTNVETFDTFQTQPTWTWGGSFEVLSGSKGTAAKPWMDINGNYATVPSDTSNFNPNYATIAFNGVYNNFGLYWGSMDSYNTLTFYLGTTVVASFTGDNATIPNYQANGDQQNYKTNHYVNILNLPAFDNIKMTSTQYAFEVDNIAVGVPEPGTLLLLGVGLVGLAGLRTRSKKS